MSKLKNWRKIVKVQLNRIPPRHLSAESREWWKTVLADYELTPHDLVLLRRACDAMDRGEQARKLLAREGLTIATEHGVKTHPAVAVERGAAQTLIHLIKALGLNKTDETKRPVGRPQEY